MYMSRLVGLLTTRRRPWGADPTPMNASLEAEPIVQPTVFMMHAPSLPAGMGMVARGCS